MARKKTSEAVIKSARFNPATSDEDAAVLEIINALEEDGWNFKQIASDAILRAGGKTPEMFSSSTPLHASLIGKVEDLLAGFAEEIIQKIEESGVRIRPDDEDTGTAEKPSPFARNFANGFMQRQRQVLGDDE